MLTLYMTNGGQSDHYDKNNVGPTLQGAFHVKSDIPTKDKPVLTGGCIDLPGLGLAGMCLPGDVNIFYAGKELHAASLTFGNMERVVVSIYNHIRIYKLDRAQRFFKPGFGMRSIEDKTLPKYPPFFDTYAAAHDLYFDEHTKSWEHMSRKAWFDGFMRKFPNNE